MKFKTLLVETKVFCPACNSELHIGNLMFKDESNNQIVCGYCRDDYETYILTGVLSGELRDKRMQEYQKNMEEVELGRKL